MFIVMTYSEGETVARKLLSGPLSIEQTIDIAIQMARGLGEAHARAIVHRDIKPSNVILTHQNVAKIVDSGLARATRSSVSTQSVRTTSGRLATCRPSRRWANRWTSPPIYGRWES
jgi:eukaryotic-like serine/threonine-protein kinase